MLHVQNNVVMFGGGKLEDMLDDTRCVVSAFIKASKEQGKSDEVIEKACIAMIAEGFERLDENRMFDMSPKKEENNGN